MFFSKLGINQNDRTTWIKAGTSKATPISIARKALMMKLCFDKNRFDLSSLDSIVNQISINQNGDIVYNLGNDSGEYLGAGFVLIDGDVINSNGDTVISKDSYEQIKPYYNGCMIVTKFVEGQGVQHYFWNKGTETQLTGDSVITYDWGYAVSNTDSDYNEVITYYNIEGGEIKSVVDDIDTSVSTRFYEDCLVIFVTENEVTTAYSYKN